jgi:hypothetical protein
LSGLLGYLLAAAVVLGVISIAVGLIGTLVRGLALVFEAARLVLGVGFRLREQDQRIP